MEKKFETIKLERKNHQSGIILLTLDRPHSMNAMNTRMAIEINEVFQDLYEDESIRVLILTGSGSRSFCVGADLKERNGMSQEDWKIQHGYFEKVTENMREFPYPVIAAINGFALGGGMEIALSCDIRIASDTAQLSLPEAKLGLIPGLGGTQLLSRIVPPGTAKEILFTGKRFSAQEGKEIGLINHIYDDETLLENTIKLAETIAHNAPLSIKAAKRLVNYGTDTELSQGILYELKEYYKCANSEDRFEGIKAFNEKRVPQWKGK